MASATATAERANGRILRVPDLAEGTYCVPDSSAGSVARLNMGSGSQGTSVVI